MDTETIDVGIGVSRAAFHLFETQFTETQDGRWLSERSARERAGKSRLPRLLMDPTQALGAPHIGTSGLPVQPATIYASASLRVAREAD
jgi:hypothetical protein